MKTAVNPVSSIAPGPLRDLFSPNWLGREEKRLFGEDENATVVAEPSCDGLDTQRANQVGIGGVGWHIE